MTEGDSDGASADGGRTEETGYVHRPSGEPPRQSADEAEFGWSGWLLVGMVVVAFLLVPGAILVLPAAKGVIASLGLTLRDAYLTLPLVPAFALGALAVWAALRSRAS